MNPADEAHRSRGERRLIVAEESAGARESYGQIIGTLSLPKISSRSGWRVLRSKHAEHEPGAVDHGDNHVHAHRIHCGLDNVLHIGNLQGLNSGRWRGRYKRHTPAATAPYKKCEHAGNPQSKKDAGNKHFSL